MPRMVGLPAADAVDAALTAPEAAVVSIADYPTGFPRKSS